MSGTGRNPENDAPKSAWPSDADQKLSEPEVQAVEETRERKPRRARYPDMQSAARFPIKLPVAVHSKSGDRVAETSNISANGVLFQVVDSDMPVGSSIDFTIQLPGRVVGASVDVQL